MNNAKFIIDNEDVPKTANSRIYTEKFLIYFNQISHSKWGS